MRNYQIVVTIFFVLLSVGCGGDSGQSPGGGSASLVPGVANRAAATTSAESSSTVEISGQVEDVSSGFFLLQTGEPHGYIDVYTNASTVISGTAPYVGEYVLVAGTGSLSVSITATKITQESSTGATATTLPPQGVYNSCEIDTALTTMCEQEDAAMASDGYQWEINYIGLMAHETGTQSLQAWFTYDASIGMGQIFAVEGAINDPVNVLTGTRLVTINGDNNLASDCGATNNEQVISCIYKVASSVPGFHWKWYTYDEPGCPNQTIGYCQGTLAGGNYNNVATLAQYIYSIDPTHPVIGTEVGDTGGQTVTNTEFSWLLSAASPVTGFDHYPIPENGNFGMIDDIGTIAGYLANTIAADYSPEQVYYVGQAFSWYQESGKGCTSITVCPYPTTAQMQDMRDQALYYANKAGKPMSLILWYYWPDITCLNTYPGCSASANRASLKSAAFAPFPATPPP
jgi:hypothetical protein